MSKKRKELQLLLKVVAFLYTKTNLLWYFTGPDAYLAVLAKSAKPYMLVVAKKKAMTMGNKSGIPDICILDSPPAIKGCKGVYIELKVDKNTTSKEQKKWFKDLGDRGYHVEVVRDSINNFKECLSALGYEFKGKPSS